MVCGIAHTSVVVSDVERSLRFYRDLLGMRVTEDERISGEFVSTVTGLAGADVRVVLLDAGDETVRVELVQFLAPTSEGAAPAFPQIGTSHVAFLTRDIHAHHRRLVKAGVRVVLAPASDGIVWAMHFFDPDGIRVELIELVG